MKLKQKLLTNLQLSSERRTLSPDCSLDGLSRPFHHGIINPDIAGHDSPHAAPSSQLYNSHFCLIYSSLIHTSLRCLYSKNVQRLICFLTKKKMGRETIMNVTWTSKIKSKIFGFQIQWKRNEEELLLKWDDHHKSFFELAEDLCHRWEDPPVP